MPWILKKTLPACRGLARSRSRRVGALALAGLVLAACVPVFFALAQAVPAARLKSGMRALDLRVTLPPTSAPADVASLAATRFPDPAECCDLEFPDAPGTAREYAGPDGGLVKRSSSGAWTWTRKDGALVWSGTGSRMTLKFGRHEVESHRLEGRKGDWTRRGIWKFPDGTMLRRWWNDRWKRYIHTYVNLTGEKALIKRLIEPGVYASEVRRSGIFEYHYDKKLADFVDTWDRSERKQKLFALLEKELNASNSGVIPLLILNNVDDYNDYLQEKTRKRPGGRGDDDGVLICCGDDFAKPAANAVEAEYRRRNQNFSLLLHETAHNLIWHGCFNRPDFLKNPEQRAYPGMVYTEGMAEWVTTTINPAYRAHQFHTFYKLLDEGKLPPYETLASRDRAHKYTPMLVIWYYVEWTHGRKALSDFLTHTCYGHKEDEAARKIAGRDIRGLYADTIVYLRQNRAAIEARYAGWRMEQLERVLPLPPGASRRLPADYVWPADARAVRSIPDIRDAYKFDLARYQGKLKATFAGPAGELVRLYGVPSGSYSVEVGPYIVYYYHKEDGTPGSMNLTRGKYSISVDTRGNRYMRFPDGSMARELSSQPGRIQAFDKNSKPL